VDVPGRTTAACRDASLPMTRPSILDPTEHLCHSPSASSTDMPRVRRGYLPMPYCPTISRSKPVGRVSGTHTHRALQLRPPRPEALVPEPVTAEPGVDRSSAA